MKLVKPDGLITQAFGANANPYYKGVGLKGHTGIDFKIGWKKTYKSAVTGEVYSLLNFGNKNYDKYRAVFQIVNDKDFSYEVSYGHLDSTPVKEGQIVQAGEVIGKEGNYGICYSGGKLVTPDEKVTGKGSHLHFQVRKLKRVSKRISGKQYIRNSEGYLKYGKLYYEVIDYDNGYNGCIDPAQFFGYKPKFQFTKDLKRGDKGEEVKRLQEELKRLGFFEGETTNLFGYKTEQAVKDFQKKYESSILWTIGLKQPTGFFGPSTQKVLNSLV